MPFSSLPHIYGTFTSGISTFATFTLGVLISGTASGSEDSTLFGLGTGSGPGDLETGGGPELTATTTLAPSRTWKPEGVSCESNVPLGTALLSAYDETLRMRPISARDVLASATVMPARSGTVTVSAVSGARCSRGCGGEGTCGAACWGVAAFCSVEPSCFGSEAASEKPEVPSEPP